jgi:hypothetical protein
VAGFIYTCRRTPGGHGPTYSPGKGGSAKWVLAAFQTTLAEARDLRDKWRKVLMDGRNPIEARRSGTGKAGQTFGLCVAEFLATKSPQWRNAKHQGQWRRTLEGYAAPYMPAGR